ncbi:MAG: ATP synthase F1 subunit epsilon [Chloroflexi bacterium]|nr:ATP synthase F1 subunit epsilon [Chloroflexota bacterium]
MPIRCEIVSQDRLVYSGNADIVIVPGITGEMGILPNHAPLLSTMKYGVLKVRYQGQEEVFTVAGGVVEVLPDAITILADAAENVDEINVARAQEAKERAEKLLREIPPEDADTYLKIETTLRRSNLRLEAAKRYGGRHPIRSHGLSEGEKE